MVRVFIKGGVWKNSEDEILKAAVMKYGKQQWARVASLLNRKSAKQCKARWNEWLDPSVKKIDWSREEDEKLLHLAKLLPAQWRTIGPLVGRTASQSQERYETLLDEAAGGGGRREGFKPGEIDPHPETKPARPDPIDMDEDEIEMLQEARARLANTQGKKAKRKQREKMLKEAKRLADLQKRRELKQAGLLSSRMRTRARRNKRGRREIDYGIEIPFHKPAPAGFHDTESEDLKADKILQRRMKDVNAKKVNESQYRTRDREALLAKKKEEARLRALEKANAALAVAEISKKNDPVSHRKRGILNMPAPTVTDAELTEVAKLSGIMGSSSRSALMLPPPNRNAATDALLGDYSDRPLPTPMRTPQPPKPSAREAVMREANNLRMLESGETPLLGGINPEIDVNATPNISKNTTDTPIQRKTINMTPVHRDYLHLNPTDNISLASNSIKHIAREERRAAKRARKELEQALSSLPVPQFDYELAVPDLASEEEDKKVAIQPDAADLEKQKAKSLAILAAKIYEKRSTVVKRHDLPRPTTAPKQSPPHLDPAQTLIYREMIALIYHDAHAHPPLVYSATKKKEKKRKIVEPPRAPRIFIRIRARRRQTSPPPRAGGTRPFQAPPPRAKRPNPSRRSPASGRPKRRILPGSRLPNAPHRQERLVSSFRAGQNHAHRRLADGIPRHHGSPCRRDEAHQQDTAKTSNQARRLPQESHGLGRIHSAELCRLQSFHYRAGCLRHVVGFGVRWHGQKGVRFESRS